MTRKERKEMAEEKVLSKPVPQPRYCSFADPETGKVCGILLSIYNKSNQCHAHVVGVGEGEHILRADRFAAAAGKGHANRY